MRSDRLAQHGMIFVDDIHICTKSVSMRRWSTAIERLKEKRGFRK